MGRFRVAFPYILFLAMAGAVLATNLRRGPAGPEPSLETVAPETRPRADVCPICEMPVVLGGGITVEESGFILRFCCKECKSRYLKLHSAAAPMTVGRLFDPVCKMEVNQAWGIRTTHKGVTYHFCAEQCRYLFEMDPSKYLGERCVVCELPLIPDQGLPATYLGSTYFACSKQHREEFLEDPASFFMHRMWGIPDWLYYLSIGMVLVVSFFMFEGMSALRGRRGFVGTGPGGEGESSPGAPSNASSERVARGDRIDLMRFRPIRKLLLSRPFRFVIQFIVVSAFLLILSAGLFGNQNPALNIAPLLTWTLWWCGLVILIMFAGKAWCYLCPWDAIASWMEKKRFWKKRADGAGLNMPWPHILRNIWLATFLFVGLTWIELGFGVTMKPRMTAYLGILMLLMAIVSAYLYEGKSFCRYGCLVGRVSGLYAMFAGIEIRNRNRHVCVSCRSKECVHGNDAAYGCPTFEYPGTMATNTYCIQCTECLQSCPHDNLAVNLRPWGSDLAVEGKPRTDEAYLALLMLAITAFHGLTMTPVWRNMIAFLETILPFGHTVAFSVGMSLLMGFPVVIYAALVWVSYRITKGAEGSTTGPTSYHDYFIRYAYCVLPIALFYHLAHNLEHMLMDGPKVVALLSDPFGWGWNLFGTAGSPIPPLVSLDVLWILQVVLVGVGHVYSLWAAQKISRRTFQNERAASRGQLPMLVGMIAFSIFSLWLLKQPMEMRTSAM
jgi:YHS domain-containing protein